jgi:hypothetical protein
MVCLKRPWPLLVAALAPLLVFGCMPMKSMRVASVALTLEDVAKAAAKQPDPMLIRDGMPAYLMLLDGLLEAYPEDRRLHLAACQTYTNYASTLPQDGESQSRAQAMYLKARDHGFRSLSSSNEPDQLKSAAAGDLEGLKSLLQKYGKKDIAALFWATAAWAGWIGSSTGLPQAVADLPALEAAIVRLIELDEFYYYGGPHLLMGAYLSAKPPVTDRNLAQAKVHFDKALRIGGDEVLATRVMYAEYYARGIRDRELFKSTLRAVIEAPEGNIPELILSNAMAREKARKLLNKTEEYFDGPI